MILATKVKVRQLSKKLGLDERAVIDRAVTLLARQLEASQWLDKETEQWEALSNEAWRKIRSPRQGQSLMVL